MAENKRDGNQFVNRGGKVGRRKRKSGRFSAAQLSAGLAATCKTYSLWCISDHSVPMRFPHTPSPCVCVYATVCWCREGRGSVTGTLTNRQTGVPAGRVVSCLWNLIFAHFPGIAQPVKHRRVPPISQSTKKEDGTLNWSKQQKHICCLKLSVSH